MPQLFLFGEMPVTREDIDTWLTAAGRDAGSPRREYYVRAWSVVDKIRAAKLADRWPPD